MPKTASEVRPDVLAVKRRLMICWANASRSWLEDPAAEVDGKREPHVLELTNWFESQLAPFATEHERERHRRDCGTWSEREIVDDSWDAQAAKPLVWALGACPSTGPR